MIKKVEQLLKYSRDYIADFLSKCTVDEKIDAHYISVSIISKNEISIKKANGQVVDRVDMILNAMWNFVLLDWNYLRLNNAEWFSRHVGYSFYMFYLPSSSPLSTEYKNVRYIFDRAVYNGKEADVHVVEELSFPSMYNFGFKMPLVKVGNEDVRKLCDEIHTARELTASVLNDIFKRSIDYDSSYLFAAEEPEGFIFKKGNQIYQIINKQHAPVDVERSSYEFLLCDFIKYCQTHPYIDKITQSYVKTICNLFNDYIINYEKVSNRVKDNIDAESIENPYIGMRSDIGIDYIPDLITKNLCKQLLYKNIFKVLLANLRKGKDYSHCVYMNNKQVNSWNNIVKNIKARAIYI